MKRRQGSERKSPLPDQFVWTAARATQLAKSDRTVPLLPKTKYVPTTSLGPDQTHEPNSWRKAMKLRQPNVVGCLQKWLARYAVRSHPPPGRARAKGESKMKLGPRPAGRPWTPPDDAQLLALLDLKMDRALIAWNLKRTVSAISKRRAIWKRRLAELGLKAKK